MRYAHCDHEGYETLLGIMSDNVLMCIEKCADLSRPWIEVLTPQVVTYRTNWSFHVYLNKRGKDTGISTNDMTTTCNKEKNPRVKFLQREKKYESRSTDAGLKS